jgi:hypothetical protein
MKLARLLSARALLWLARAAGAGLDMLDTHKLRSRLARLCVQIAHGFAGLAELIAPWTRPDYVPPVPDDLPPTLRTMTLALGRAKLARWRLRLGRIIR